MCALCKSSLFVYRKLYYNFFGIFRLYEDNTRKGKLVVQGLEEVQVQDKQDVYRILAQGSEKRKTGLFTFKKKSTYITCLFTK